MRRYTPSPAMVVAFIALIVAMTGTAFAAVNFAKDSGAVDGKSAVASGATLSSAAGKLVATQKSGSGKGKIASKYLDIPAPTGPASSTFGKAFDAVDNATGVATPIGAIAGLGTLSAQCTDQDAKAGIEDPSTIVTFANTSGTTINLARTVGAGNPFIAPLANGTQDTFTITGSNTFTLQLEKSGTNYLAQGVVRQDGKGTPTATCLIYGLALTATG